MVGGRSPVVSSQTPYPLGAVMSIWNKVLLGLIFVTSLAFMYMAARTLKTHETWRVAAQKQEDRLKDLNEQIEETRHAETDQNVITDMGIDQLREELFSILIDRGESGTTVCRIKSTPRPAPFA